MKSKIHLTASVLFSLLFKSLLSLWQSSAQSLRARLGGGVVVSSVVYDPFIFIILRYLRFYGAHLAFLRPASSPERHSPDFGSAAWSAGRPEPPAACVARCRPLEDGGLEDIPSWPSVSRWRAGEGAFPCSWHVALKYEVKRVLRAHGTGFLLSFAKSSEARVWQRGFPGHIAVHFQGQRGN